MKNEIFTVRGIDSVSTMNRSSYEDYQRRLKSRRDEGRYTLEEAAMTFADGTGERADEMRSKLMAAAFSHALPVYEPGRKARYQYGNGFASEARHYYEEARWCDLNAWLADNEPLVEFEFPTPSDRPETAVPTEETPASRRASHDVTTERGCRRSILEQWGEIESLYGPNADGHQVLRVLNRNKDSSQKQVVLKTVQNKLGQLRKENLIP